MSSATIHNPDTRGTNQCSSCNNGGPDKLGKVELKDSLVYEKEGVQDIYMCKVVSVDKEKREVTIAIFFGSPGAPFATSFKEAPEGIDAYNNK